jgi:hypothetical protein
VLEGKALQLVAYSLMQPDGAEREQMVEYWELPKSGAEGTITSISLTPPQLADFQARISDGLAQMQRAETCFVATGEGQSSGDYAGISRFDEWAG